MITFDGDRSLKRKWFAKKQISIIREIGIPAKTINWDGFTFSVWQQDELSGGRITAPMGAVALLSSQNGISIASMDHWLGPCTSYNGLKVLYVNDDHTVILDGSETEEELLEKEYVIIDAKPDIMAAYYKVDEFGVNDVKVADYSCSPSITPYYTAEAYTVTVTDKLYVDLNNNGIPDFPYDHLESTLTWYNSSNNNLTKRRSVAIANGPQNIWKTCINLPMDQRVAFSGYHYNTRYNPTSGKYEFICAQHEYKKTDVDTGALVQIVDDILLSDIVPENSNMPQGLRALMLDVPQSIARPIGSYAFTDNTGKFVIVHAAWFFPDAISIDGTTPSNTPTSSWFFDHSGYGADDEGYEQDWTVFISIFTRDVVDGVPVDTVLLYKLSQFFDVLDSAATQDLFGAHGYTETGWWVGPAADDGFIWGNISTMLIYYFSWPNSPGLIDYRWAWMPHDSAMFHSEDGTVYSWTRSAGTISIGTTGVSAVSVFLPSDIINNTGTRPDISYAGNGLYFCACNDIGKRIRSIHYGSPFYGWTKIIDPPEMLVHIRPVEISEDVKLLIGIVKDTSGENDVYRFVYYSEQGGNPGRWSLLAALPFNVGEADNFSIGLYGNNPMVTALLNFPHPPPATPQNIVVPYEAYAEFQP